MTGGSCWRRFTSNHDASHPHLVPRQQGDGRVQPVDPRPAVGLPLARKTSRYSSGPGPAVSHLGMIVQVSGCRGVERGRKREGVLIGAEVQSGGHVLPPIAGRWRRGEGSVRAAAGPPSQRICVACEDAIRAFRRAGLWICQGHLCSRETLAAFFACSSRPGYNSFPAATQENMLGVEGASSCRDLPC